MKEMGNLSHDRCFGTDKSTQKSGYGELTRKIPPLEKGLLPTSPFEKGGWRGISKISPKPLFTKEGNEHPHPFPPPSEGEDEGEGEKIQNHPSRIERG